jgi:Trk-type K+ transport system membrane component
VVALMFIGRLGPLTLALALSRKRRVDYQYAEEPVLVG